MIERGRRGIRLNIKDEIEFRLPAFLTALSKVEP